MKQLFLIDAGSIVARCLSVVGENFDLANVALTYMYLKCYLSVVKKYNHPIPLMAWDTGYEHRRNISQLAFDNGIITKTYKQARREKKQADAQYDAWKKPLKDQQVESLKNFLNHTNIQSVSFEENEADDIIGSYCERYKKFYDIIILTSDKDYYQLLDDNVRIFDLGRKMEFTKQDFVNAYGIQPKQWIDVGALAGDAGDTIQGIDGIGETTALKIIQKYGSYQKALEDFATFTEKKKTEQKALDGAKKLDVAYELKKMIMNLQVPDICIKKTDKYQLEKVMEDYKLYILKKDIDFLLNAEVQNQQPILITASNTAGKKFYTCPKCGTQYMSENEITCDICNGNEQLTFDLGV